MARSQREPDDDGETQAAARQGDAGGFETILRSIRGLPSAAAEALRGEYRRAIASSATTALPRRDGRVRILDPPVEGARARTRRGGGERSRRRAEVSQDDLDEDAVDEEGEEDEEDGGDDEGVAGGRRMRRGGGRGAAEARARA